VGASAPACHRRGTPSASGPAHVPVAQPKRSVLPRQQQVGRVLSCVPPRPGTEAGRQAGTKARGVSRGAGRAAVGGGVVAVRFLARVYVCSAVLIRNVCRFSAAHGWRVDRVDRGRIVLWRLSEKTAEVGDTGDGSSWKVMENFCDDRARGMRMQHAAGRQAGRQEDDVVDVYAEQGRCMAGC